MKNWSKGLGILGFLAAAASAQLQPGDIAFTGWNADGTDNIAFVALKDIPANTRIYFCDANWNGTAFPTNEGDFSWVSSSVVPAGTVVAINGVDSASTVPTMGTMAHDNSGGLGNSDEAMFAYFATPDSVRKPSVFLAAASNGGSFGTLTGTGLTFGSTAIALKTGADIAAYAGPRSGLTAAGYLAALNDTLNWISQDASGNQHMDGTAPDLPFNLAAFTLPPLGPGDIAFTGWNADGVDNLAFVALKDIPANTRIYFCDSEWNGTGFGTDEGDFSWVSSSLVPAGTVVAINGVDSTVTVASTGSLAHDNSGGLGNSDEAMFAYLVALHPDSVRRPSTFLTATSNGGTASFGTLAGTGLTAGSTAILIKTGADIAAYTGPRSGQSAAGYLAALNDTLNSWISQDASGNQHVDGTAPDLPFSLTAFTFGVTVSDTTKPTVTNVAVTAIATMEVTFSEAVDSATAVNTANYALNPVLSFSAAVYNKAQRKVTLTHAAFTIGANYTLQIQNVKDTANNTMTLYTSGNLAFNGVTPALSFAAAHYSRRENSGTLQILINASATPVTDTARVGIRLVAGGTAAAGTDFTFANQTFVWPRDSAGPRMLSIPLLNNGTAQADRFFVLELHNPAQATLGAATRLSVYILDDDTQAPARSGELGLKFVSSFKVDTTSGASAEIVAYDPKSKRLFAMNSTRDRLEILNFRNPRAISKIATIDLLAYGSGGTSVAVRNGLVAVTIDAANFAPGKVVFLDTNGVVLRSVTVGSLPDMVGFSPDGKFVLTANEGQPSNDYLTDPEGSVSIIDMTGGIDSVTQARVTTAGFTAFNGQEAALRAAGGRIFGINATVAKDFEPEYITVSDDSKTAWVTLQENNIIARLDLQTKAFTHLFPLGFKDHNLARNALDASDQSDSLFMGTWPVKGVYMPDAIAGLKVGDTTFLFTANEGDAREYTALTEEVRVGAGTYVLDSTVFPNAAILKLPANLGRLTVSSKTGDLNNDGRFEEIHVLGARSFSVWNGTTGAQVWDSGDEFERITAADSAYGSLFNASHDGNARKNRSDNKGPEPEGITIASIGNRQYAFIALERIGGVMAYEVTNPRAPRFVTYANNRATGSTLGGDLGSEGIIFIPRAQSPNDTALIVLANEISATVSVYAVRDTNTVSVRPGRARASGAEAFRIYRAPGNLVFFSRPANFKLADARGKVLRSGTEAAWVDLGGLKRGRYFLSVPGVETFVLPVVE